MALAVEGLEEGSGAAGKVDDAENGGAESGAATDEQYLLARWPHLTSVELGMILTAVSSALPAVGQR